MTTAATPRPSPGSPRPYRFPAFEERRLANGLTVVIAPVHKLPIVSAHTVIHSGAALDPAGREGLAAIVASLVTEGAGTMDGAALTERFELLGTGLDTSAGWDATSLRLTVTPARLPAALALLAGVLREPLLPERELERLREERLAELLQMRAEPRSLADEEFSRVVYAPDARYAKPEGGGEESVRALTLDDVRAWHQAHFTPANTTLILAGDIDADAGEELVAAAVGDWTSSGNAERRHAENADAQAAAGPSRLRIVMREGAAQSEVRVGHVGLPRKHPDYFPAAVMNAILGGLFSSRINLNLREEHGYTYGAFSEFDWRVGAGPFVVASAVQSDATAESVREVLNEIDKMRAADVTDAELSLATDFLQGVFPIRYESAQAIAGALANMFIYGLPRDYFDRYRERIGAIRPADVRRAAVEYLHPEQLYIVVVGVPETIETPLAALGLGAATVVNAEGKPVSNRGPQRKEPA